MKKVYKYYKERLVEISGRSRSLYSKKISKKSAYDIGKILDGDYDEINDFTDFLWHGKKRAYTLICNKHKARLFKNLNTEDKKVILGQVSDLKTLKREMEDFARETGRQELFVGYPFVQGALGRDMIIRAPLLLFPATIHIEDETTVEIELKQGDAIQLNKVFILAYAKHHNLNIDEMDLDATPKFKNIEHVVKYLRGFGFKLGYIPRKGLFNFETSKEPKIGDPMEIRQYAVIGRFPLANAIYNDYNLLEKKKPTQAIKELLDTSIFAKKIKNVNTDLYVVSSLDFAQEQAVEQLNKAGNMVIYGPPGTGKSQTIVNIITDALCKNKRVLVVSQKKAALDVVYNRLGILNDRAMYLNDPEKGKNEFYVRTKTTHHDVIKNNIADPRLQEEKYKKIKTLIDKEVEILENITETLWTPLPFGITLQEMYAQSYQFGKDALERLIYEKVINNQKLMGCKYNELSSTLRIIKEKRKGELYFKRLKMFQGNPIIAHIKDDLSVHTIGQVNSFITKLANSSKIVPFNFAAYPNARQALAFYLENGLENGHLRPVIKFIARVERKKVSEIEKNFKIAMMAIRRYVEEYSLLESVLDKKGFAMTLEGVLNGNATLLKLLSDALTNYVVVRDMNINLRTMTELDMTILNLAYNIEKTSQKGFLEVISKILPARIYHELVKGEERYKQRLSKIMDFENVKDRIISLKAEQRETVKQICLDMFKKSYITKYNSDGENKNFLYQIGKPQNLWSIRKLMDVYGDLMLELFPCWLLSPENVSTIMPLREGMFDLILFDEASQIFIESTLPTIYRGKHIVIAGDNKQLRPSAHFMRRYMGSDIDELDLNTQAALEVESLLDLATSRYNGINLNYHYRSAHEEFINFSNHAFYDCRLQIAPNLSRNIAVKPIERIKVEGRWIDRKNKTEAQQVVNLIKKLFKTRKNNESIGVITFNAEQEQYIKDLIDAEMKQNVSVNNQFLSEFNRKEHGEDISLFIKNIENVQGDERDIIIFCIGYAKNEQGKVLAHFGPLNMEGGENRLNVAITRAKKKIYVVTSIEPDELMVENTKNQGPKLFKKYLQYVQAVSSGNKKQADIILEGFRTQNQVARPSSAGIANGIKEALEKQGWTVEADLGNAGYKLSLAIYDKQLDRYLVGIECDDTAYHSSSSILERDVFRSKFMESRGWNILRIWSRDWWLNPTKVINQITKEAKRSRDKMMSK